MTAALVGFGAMARHGHLPWYEREGAPHLVAVVEPTADGRAAAHALRPDVKLYPTLAELLDHHDPTFVDIAAPPSAHGALVLEALAAGVHVLCEKPFVTSIDALADVARCRRGSGLLVAACHNWYFAPAIDRALALLDQGCVGDPIAVTFIAERARAAAGATYWRPEWRLSIADGGGIIADLGYHGFYLANRVMRSRPVDIRVPAVRAADAGRAEDGATIELVYSAGRTATLDLSWTAAAKRTELRVAGPAGVLAIRDNHLRTVRADGEIDERFESLVTDSWHAGWTAGTLDGFVAALQSGEHDAAWQDIEGAVTTLCAALSEAAPAAGNETGAIATVDSRTVV